MDEGNEWRRVDARILGQILAAQNLMFVLPDKARIAEFFSQAMAGIPGVVSCCVCLGDSRAAAGAGAGSVDEVCGDCAAPRQSEGGEDIPYDFACDRASRTNMRTIALKTAEHAFGFFSFRIDSSDAFEPYHPFLSNLANYVALSLDNRLQRTLLEKTRDELKARTVELGAMNNDLEEMNRIFVGRELRMVELKAKIAELEGRKDGRS